MRPNVEAIREFKVQTNLFSADQGRNPGGQINVVTKSGGNTIHGAVYEFLRNDRFDANNFFSNRAGQEKPPFEQNQFGGAVGGPIVKNRTFFFADYDGFRQEVGRVFVNTVPTLKMRQGDFSELSGAIYDPLTTVALSRRELHPPAVPRQCHSAEPLGPGDRQADERVSAAEPPRLVQQPGHVADAHPGLEPVRRAHRSHAEPARTTSSAAIPVEDRDRQPVHVRRRRDFPGCRKPSASATRTPSPVPRRWSRSTRCSAGCTCSRRAWCWIPAPATTTSISISRRPTSRLAINSGNSSACPTPTSRIEQNGIPIFSPAGYTGIGQSRSLPILRHEKTFQYVVNLTFAGDKHTIKAGVDVRRRHMGEFQTNRGNGRFNFSPNITNNPVEQHGRPRDGVVPARRAQPDRAGLPARRRRHPRHRVQRLRRATTGARPRN